MSRNILLVFAMVYLLALVALAPASFLLPYVSNLSANQVSQVSGSTWQGRLTALRLSPANTIDLQWTFLPASMLTLQPRWQLNMGQFNTKATVSPFQQTITQLVLDDAIPLNLNAKGNKHRFTAQLHGDIRMPLACNDTSGNIVLSAVKINKIDLGDLSGQLNCNAGRYQGSLKGKGSTKGKPVKLTFDPASKRLSVSIYTASFSRQLKDKLHKSGLAKRQSKLELYGVIKI